MPLFYSEKGFLKAARNGDVETLKKYLATDKAGAMLAIKDEHGLTALHLAATYAHLDCFKLLLAAGADLHAKTMDNKTMLHLVARHVHSDFIAIVLQSGLKPDARLSGNTDSPLAIAAGHNRADSVRQLLEAGADINDRAAVITAFRNGYNEIAEMLTEKGADINLPDDYYQYTPLHFIASNGNMRLFHLLLAQGNIGLDAKSKDGSTPLHLAAYNGHIMLVEALVKAGADTDIENNEGLTAADVALKRGQQQAAKIIQQKMREKTETTEKQTLYAVPAAADTSEDRETWLRIGNDKIAHIGIYPALERKLTDIFNFATRERLTISENLRTGVENTLPPQPFDMLPETALDVAFDAYQAQGGKISRDIVVKKQLSAKPAAK
jgi:cytohesin